MTQISVMSDVFTLINTFYTSSDRQASIVQSLRTFTEKIASAHPGFLSASVHVSLDGARVVNYVQWRTSADLQSLLVTPAAKAHMAEVIALADRIDPVPYAVAFVGVSP
ncbi:antibiotic biosynthesis monooxygenase [Ralstonia pickettii]|nr:antibiotic biosynthesis monooxygenase [Ralstonia pickettii]